MLYDSSGLYMHTPESSGVWWYGEFFSSLSWEQNKEASWLLAVVFAARSSAAFRPRHRRHEATPQSAFITTSSLMSVWCVWAWLDFVYKDYSQQLAGSYVLLLRERREHSIPPDTRRLRSVDIQPVAVIKGLFLRRTPQQLGPLSLPGGLDFSQHLTISQCQSVFPLKPIKFLGS